MVTSVEMVDDHWSPKVILNETNDYKYMSNILLVTQIVEPLELIHQLVAFHFFHGLSEHCDKRIWIYNTVSLGKY